jgi:hypothetical protein
MYEEKMSDALATYLHDRLAGSYFAIKLLSSLSDRYKDADLGAFARSLAVDIKQDQDTLRQVIDKVGKANLDLMEAVGWLMEKASRFKLQSDESGEGIGTFEALETLTLGIEGKADLWSVLAVICEVDSRVPAYEFDKLIARAQDQFQRVEVQRLSLARTTFGLHAR